MGGSVYKVIELVGTSSKSWEDAANAAVETAGENLRNLRIAEVEKLDIKIDDDGVVCYRAKLKVSFRIERQV